MSGPGALIAVVGVPAWATAQSEDEAYEQNFVPFLAALEQSGGYAAVLFAGRLLESWAERKPDALRRIRAVVAEGRLELLASGLHRPVCSAVPERDMRGQFEAHITLVKRALGVRPCGAWIPHGIWEPTLPRLLHKVDLRWTALDRNWLVEVGAPAARVLMVEREGRAVAVIPSGPLGTGRGGLASVRLRDPESAAAAAAAVVNTKGLPSSLREGRSARAYLPCGGPEGLWERDLLEDAGADGLHKRVLQVSRLVRRFEQAEGEGRYAEDGPDPFLLHQARRYLYRSQAAEAYAPCPPRVHVHGAFRDRAWRDVLRAEAAVREGLQLPSCDGVQGDLDCDGLAEARVWTRSWSATLAPERQGILTEISHIPSAANVLCGGLATAFLERWGLQPVAIGWSLVTTESGGDGSMRAVMCADSALDGVPVRLTKRVLLPDSGPLEVRLDIENRGLQGARAKLSTELFCTLGGPRLDGREEASLSVEVAGAKVPLDELIELPEIEAIGLIGWRVRIEFELDPPARVEVEPLEEGASRISFSWPVELWGRERERRTIRLNIREEPHG